MKKLLTLLLTAAFAVAACLVGCQNNTVKSQKDVHLVVAAEDVEKSFTASGGIGTLEDAMKLLAETDETFTYSGTYSSQYGLMVTEMLGITPAAGSYWMIYTDTLKREDGEVYNASEEYTYEYSGTTYYSTMLGASSYEVDDGETMLFVLLSF